VVLVMLGIGRLDTHELKPLDHFHHSLLSYLVCSSSCRMISERLASGLRIPSWIVPRSLSTRQ
jgi:hypothetical protein